MSKIKRHSLVVLYLFFLIVLFFANDLILLIPRSDYSKVRKIASDKYAGMSNVIEMNIESFIETRDLLMSVEIMGWAFIETGQESVNKNINLVFVSETDTYEVTTEVQERFNLRNLFNSHDIIGINHGYFARFSPLRMENGTYKLFIYCQENDDIRGIIDTENIFMKTYQGLSKIDE